MNRDVDESSESSNDYEQDQDGSFEDDKMMDHETESEQDNSPAFMEEGGFQDAFLASLPPPPRQHIEREEGDDDVEGLLKFMIIDIQLRQSNQKYKKITEAVLFGRSETGESVCVFVEGWQPYLYIKAPEGWIDDELNRELLKDELNSIMMTQSENRKTRASTRPEQASYHEVRTTKYNPKKKDSSMMIFAVTTVMKKSIYGYSPEGLVPYLKVEVANSYLISMLRDGLETKKLVMMNNHHDSSSYPAFIEHASGSATETFNSNLDSVLQLMVDLDMRGCQWCQLTDGERQLATSKRSDCDVEWKARTYDLKMLPVDDMFDLGSLRILSFDIEAAGRRGVFPEAQYDPVIQIAIHFHVLGSSPIKPVLLSYKSCDSIADANVICFENELDMLLYFKAIVKAFDPDIFTGYNICNFDFPYLIKRAQALSNIHGMETERGGFEYMTRYKDSKLSLRETEFQSAQTGKRKRVRIAVAGRVCLDMYTNIQNNQSFRLEKYTLNAVAEHFLGDKKVDLPFTQITPMWERDASARRELGLYCLKDAQLPLDLMLTLDSLTQTVEMARCTGISFDWVLQRGIMIRNTSLLLRRSLHRNFVFPNLQQSRGGGNHKVENKERYEGATVLDAHGGIHKNVGVLDFSSMYPSIIRAHNLCFSTIILDSRWKHKQSLCVHGHSFVAEEEAKGLIPEVVEILIQCRAKAKVAYAQEQDPVKKKTTKAREMAFKIASNGMYGALGSTQSMLPLLAVAETVTAIGRGDIRTVKSLAETMYPDALVVYGDTDSVFVRFHISSDIGVETQVSMASDMAKALAKEVNKNMKQPKKIEFEKVYSTMICLSKKRYAGIMYANGHRMGIDQPAMDIKGMQCVRRDGCALMRDLVRECLTSILHSGTVDSAIALAREKLLEIMDDKIPLESYAVQKTLRKSMQDCCFPMTIQELDHVRALLSMEKPCDTTLHTIADATANDQSKKQLSYAEQDEAIRKKITLPWKNRVRLPHVMLAWKMRLHDPGNAPVLGESIQYIITNNGGQKIFEKVETLDTVKAKKKIVDRKYYLDSLKTPLENIFLPIFMQQSATTTTTRETPSKDKKMTTEKEAKLKAQHQMEMLIWHVTKKRPLKHNAENRQQAIEASPIFQAFKRARTTTSMVDKSEK